MKVLKTNIYYLIVSEDQEFGSHIAEWFWFRNTQVTGVKTLTMATVI